MLRERRASCPIGELSGGWTHSKRQTIEIPDTPIEIIEHVLAKRVEKHLNELFTFVQYPGCPSDNNAAERAIRPAVVARKISGGTRSANGSKTRTILMSVLGTWSLQSRDLLQACTDMITASHTPSVVPAP